MIILDASAAVDALLNFQPNATQVRERIKKTLETCAKTCTYRTYSELKYSMPYAA